MLYGALFLVAGAALLAITYGLVANSTDMPSGKSVFVDRQAAATGKLPPVPDEAVRGAVRTPASGQAAGADVSSSRRGRNRRRPCQLLAYAGQGDGGVQAADHRPGSCS